MSFRDRLKLPRLNGKHVETSSEDFLRDLAEVEGRAQSEQARPKAEAPQVVIPSQVSQTNDLETNGRVTLYRMIATAKLDEPFSFKTARFGGEAYVQTMRTVLSRARGDMRKENRKGTVFKFFLVGIEHKPDHDLVTVMRSTHSSLKQKRATDDLVSIMTGEEGE